MTNEQKIIRNKVGLLKLAEQLDSVSKACKVMGFSRDSFYRFNPEFPIALPIRPKSLRETYRQVKALALVP